MSKLNVNKWARYAMYLDCPCCSKKMSFWGTGINVNCYSEGRVKIKDWLKFDSSCENPICEWSKIDKHDY